MVMAIIVIPITLFSGYACFCGFPVFAAILWRQRVLPRRGLFVLCLLLGVVLFFGWLWWRDISSLRELRGLVQIPEVIDATAVPSHQQLETFVSAMQKAPVEPEFATRQDMQEIAENLREHKNPISMWILVTPLAPPQ